MSKASESELARLHAAVAKTLTAAVQSDEPSAAILGAAIAFLKNNNITADPERNEELQALNDTLAKRRKDQKLSLTQVRDAAEEFERMIGPMQ